MIFLYTIIIISILYLYFAYRYYVSVEGFEGFEDSIDIPKTIWTFWDTDDLPPLISDIYKYNTKKLSEWKYVLISNKNIYDYIPKMIFPKNYDALQPSFKSDWIRLYLLKTYGGCWLDASIIINNQSALNNLYNESIEQKSELTGFFIDSSKHETLNIPLSIESWFIIAPKNGSVINSWFNEFNKAVSIGFLQYKKEIIKENINIDKIGLEYAQKDDEVYLTVFACLNKVLQKLINPLPPLLFKNAKETMFKLHSECKFNSECVMNKIKNDKNVRNIPYIKLVGADRKTNIDISSYFKEDSTSSKPNKTEK